jgi:hypothetical protein
MKIVEFILSLFIALCATILLVRAITVPSIVREFSIVAFSVILILSIALVRLTFKGIMDELKK